jgi:hypothetical protein
MIIAWGTLAVAVLIALVAGYIIGANVQRVLCEMKTMQSRITALEENQKRRNPCRTNDGLEDAMAIINDSVWQADATLDYIRSRMRQAGTTLKTIRKEPDRYDPDQPNRKRSF